MVLVLYARPTCVYIALGTCLVKGQRMVRDSSSPTDTEKKCPIRDVLFKVTKRLQRASKRTASVLICIHKVDAFTLPRPHDN